ncbi:MAG: co-chaperone GroES [Candidatus Woykebacteria bacterium RIFCSPHIGHO2_12_FULL_43_10]|uniref:Co-chaperonin GroES n=1 Tax=Candidatus Woykebacteria bacterium RIFCSPHIGHO2_02_FULL_43_16b TaxID=1802601 RepID=A0A1G1WMD0_9BACT|nr:MAG: co-chaperone GroES [Candidatus Woykebacteria bacterium RIFCSPHIGHO2_01_FULL_43_29]OGY28912.1 MAG: co-chaperone GroES [Candidatus Woykebacteria bacterium RIFCSPHIGHO2_02_FULL_43_16b]OGY30128.1 MAG: co-chaperone GroES [Candidatus Woykebacteria bacterium RIFCSPHIGHO2_12_FULL_43_10]
MKVKPLYDNVLIEPLEKEQTTSSGIVLPDTVKEKPQEGKVVAVGPGKMGQDHKIIPVSVKAGDIVIYKKWGGNEVKINGKELLLVGSDDILAVVG